PTTHNQRVLALARREVAFNYFNTHLILTFFRTNALSISEIKSVSPPRQRLECQVTSETLASGKTRGSYTDVSMRFQKSPGTPAASLLRSTTTKYLLRTNVLNH